MLFMRPAYSFGHSRGLAFILATLFFVGCAHQRYEHKDDFIPEPILDPSQLKDAEVKSEPLSVTGNPASYEVMGEEYQVMTNARGFTQEGIASWYGMKFHGHATSNGEIYDVYQMTAAHKTLPLPSHVRVTRRDTGESVVVRVNDRGPFHEGRIIDLSYAAAVKLGVDKQGTAEVTLETLSVPTPISEQWVQVTAVRNPQAAEQLQKKLQELQSWPVSVIQREGSAFHKVRIGPVPEGKDVSELLTLLESHQYPDAILLGKHQL